MKTSFRLLFVCGALLGAILLVGYATRGNRADTIQTPKESPFDDVYNFTYFLNGKDIETVLARDESGSILPERFIIEPGVYQFEKNNYDMTKEGLYRIQNKAQRLVFKDDLDAFLSSLAWTTIHGKKDHGNDYREIAMKRKLELQCGYVSAWGRDELRERGYEARMVDVTPLENWTDNGHTMLEIKRNGKWELWDLDFNCRYTSKEGQPIDATELIDRLKNDDFEIVPIAFDRYHASRMNHPEQLLRTKLKNSVQKILRYR